MFQTTNQIISLKHHHQNSPNHLRVPDAFFLIDATNVFHLLSNRTRTKLPTSVLCILQIVLSSGKQVPNNWCTVSII